MASFSHSLLLRSTGCHCGQEGGGQISTDANLREHVFEITFYYPQTYVDMSSQYVCEVWEGGGVCHSGGS